jgi:hypothetical protein
MNFNSFFKFVDDSRETKDKSESHVFSSLFIYLFNSIVVLLIVSKLPNLAILQQKMLMG